MDTFELAQLIAERKTSGLSYFEFLRVPSMSPGLYVLPAGAKDEQEPSTKAKP